MLPGETMLSKRAACRYVASLRGCKCINPYSLDRAIERGLPVHPDPFGKNGVVLYRSEIDEFLARPISAPQQDPAPGKRGRGRPRKHPRV